MPDGEVLLRGDVERIGADATLSVGDDSRQIDASDHTTALAHVEDVITAGCYGEIEAVGHRVVHGGETYSSAVRIDDQVEADIASLASLAPLHTPPNLDGMRAAKCAFPQAIHVAVFDTAFHQSIPTHAFLYALPYALYEEQGIRRYGFHGTSHRYVSARAADLLNRDTFTGITCHLGNGCSIAAIREGQSVDVSMGLTPLEGLVMGTRSGDIDPSVVMYLQRRLGKSVNDVDRLLNRESGLLGLSGVSNDLREVEQACKEGNERACDTLDVFAYRVKKYIGAYVAVLGTLDGIVLTGGIGEHGWKMRERILTGLEPLGITLDPVKNRGQVGVEGAVSADASDVTILVIPTDEERLIAEDTHALLT